MHVDQKEPCHIAPKASINIANIICLCVYKDLPYRAVYRNDSMSNHLFFTALSNGLYRMIVQHKTVTILLAGLSRDVYLHTRCSCGKWTS